MRSSSTFLLTLLSLFIVSFTSQAQTGRIAGTIVDGETGDPLFSASVLVVETSDGAVADFDGNYLIKNLQPGTYTLRVSYISFATQTITDVVVNADEVTTIDIAMQSEGVNLEEVVVSAGAILNNEAGLLRQRQKSIAFSDAISAETISSSGAGDAAAAMTKVVGASVVGGKYVYVRGLGDRYSTTHLNGVELPSADPNKKAFNLDLFPSDLIDNIVTKKTFTADKPGNFSGGLVDISTKAYPESQIFSISTGVSYNTKITGEDILLGSSKDGDYFANGASEREMPREVGFRVRNGYRIPSAFDAIYRSENDAQELDRMSKSFDSEFAPTPTTANIGHSYSVVYGNQYDIEGAKLGLIGSFTFSEKYSGYNDGSVARNELSGKYGEASQLNPTLDVTDQKGDRNNDIGLLLNSSLQFGSANEISFTTFNSRSGASTGRYLAGFEDEVGSAEFQTRVLQYVQREISYQRYGYEKLFQESGTKFDAQYSTANSGQDEPDLRFFTSQVSTLSNGDKFYANPTNNFQRPGRFFRDLDESSNNFQANLRQPFEIFEESGSIKVGYLFNEVERDFNEYRVDIYTSSQNVNLFNEVNGDIDRFFSTMGIIGEERGRPELGNYVQNASTDRSNYNAYLKTRSYYGLLELPLGTSIDLIVGLRSEDTKVVSESGDPELEVGGFDQVDLLPSVSLIYSINDQFNVRGAYTKTVAYPTFRELAPYITFDFVGDLLFAGNADLNRTLITNYDARVEYYFEPGEILAVSAFYKNMDDPIERVIRTDIGNDALSVQNVDQAEVFGIEFEFRKNLGFITPSLKQFFFSSNFTFVESQVDIPELELTVNRISDPNTPTTRDLVGQSPYLINADLSYQSYNERLTIDLSYNYFDDRLMIVTETATPDVFEKGYSTLNSSLKFEVSDNLSIGAKIKNMLNVERSFVQEYLNNNFYYSRYEPGIDISASVSYSF
ncbi:MAG: TonB-dependent receptor [Balneolaceae bacterium]|nr:TonB-dependent receptor [Balneolaceae bacterium]